MILVSGGTGVMGSRLVRSLVESGRRVRALTLPGDRYVSRLAGLDCEIVHADLAEAGSLKEVFRGVRTVYHLAAIIIAHDPAAFAKVNVNGTRHMVDGAAEAGVEHFIYVSSAAAAHPEASAYAASKAQGEAIVRDMTSLNQTIVRPTLVYERGGGQEFMMFLDYLLKYPVVPFVGSGRALKNPVLADDVVRGLLAILDNPATYGRTYNFSGGESISIRDLARLMLEIHGLVKPFWFIPFPLCRLAAAVMERTMKDPPLTRYAISRMAEDADLDNSAACRDLGYHPVGVREGLARCYGRGATKPSGTARS
jgi:NADH dehydrogenase